MFYMFFMFYIFYIIIFFCLKFWSNKSSQYLILNLSNAAAVFVMFDLILIPPINKILMDFIIFLHKVPWPLSSSYVYLFSFIFIFLFYFFFPFVNFREIKKFERNDNIVMVEKTFIKKRNESYLYVLLLLYRLFVCFKSERILSSFPPFSSLIFFLIFYCVKLNMIIATLKGLMWVKDLFIFIFKY